MPKFLEVTGETEKIINCHKTIYWMCVIQVTLTIRFGMTRFVNQESTEVF